MEMGDHRIRGIGWRLGFAQLRQGSWLDRCVCGFIHHDKPFDIDIYDNGGIEG